MNTKESTPGSGGRHAEKSRPILIERTFPMPSSRLWQAWSDVSTFKKWWGPKDFSCPEAEIDFRVGGRILACMEAKDGSRTWSTGIFKQIDPHKTIVVTDSFSDKNGNVVHASEIGMPGDWPMECLITLGFEEKGEKTVMKLKHEGIPAEMHDDCIQGWNESLDKIERL